MEKTRKLLHCPSSLSSPLPTSVFFDCVTNYHIVFYYVTHHTALGGLNNRNVFIHCSGSQKSKISFKIQSHVKGSAGPQSLGGNPCLASSNFWRLPPFPRDTMASFQSLSLGSHGFSSSALWVEPPPLSVL